MSEQAEKRVDEMLAQLAHHFKARAQEVIDAAEAELRDVYRVRYGVALEAGLCHLPAPRLQLRWEDVEDAEYQWLCHYELVFPLHEFDIRREATDVCGGFAVVELGRTRVSSGDTPIYDRSRKPLDRLPYRDGAHAQWDSRLFGGLPIYVIDPDGHADLVPPLHDGYR